MSRIGRKPIKVPEEVKIQIEGNKIFIKGPKGEVSREFRPELEVLLKQGEILVSPKAETKNTPALWGLTRTLIANMIEGVVAGFSRQLKIEGLGYRVSLEGKDLVLQVGFTHSVKVKSAEGIDFSIEGNVITVSGFDKEKVSQTAASIRKIRKPEPYKGTGIMYVDEKVRRKLGKRMAAEK